MSERELARARAVRGYDRLDRERPGWDQHWKPDFINVQDPTRCPVGLVYGSYTTHRERAGMTAEECYVHGYVEGDPANYPLLTDCWRELMRERQAARYGALAPSPERERELVSA